MAEENTKEQIELDGADAVLDDSAEQHQEQPVDMAPEQVQELTTPQPPKKAPWLKQYQFPKGVSGNPDGRPKGRYSLKTVLDNILRREAILDTSDGKVKTGKKYAQLVLEAMVIRAIGGDVQAAKMIMEYTEGKPIQILEHQGAGGKDLSTGAGVDELVNRILNDPTATEAACSFLGTLTGTTLPSGLGTDRK